MTRTAEMHDAAKAAKGQAYLDKFYQVIRDSVTNMDELIMAAAAMPTLMAYTIAKIHPGDRAAQLETANAMAEGVRHELKHPNRLNATTWQ